MSNFITIQQAVSNYRKNFPLLREQIKYYKSLSSFAEVIEAAGCFASIEKNKRSPHQRRIKKEAQRDFQKHLEGNKSRIEKAKDFDELLGIIGSPKILGIAGLTIYDTALRIGAKRDIFPIKVYLHAGTLRGFKKLGGLPKAGKGLNSVETSVFTGVLSPLKQLLPMEIEDFLCIYECCFPLNQNGELDTSFFITPSCKGYRGSICKNCT